MNHSFLVLHLLPEDDFIINGLDNAFTKLLANEDLNKILQFNISSWMLWNPERILGLILIFRLDSVDNLFGKLMILR